MPLTAADVRATTFSTTRMRAGYDMDEVDAFLDIIEADVAQYADELQRSRDGEAVLRTQCDQLQVRMNLAEQRLADAQAELAEVQAARAQRPRRRCRRAGATASPAAGGRERARRRRSRGGVGAGPRPAHRRRDPALCGGPGRGHQGVGAHDAHRAAGPRRSRRQVRQPPARDPGPGPGRARWRCRSPRRGARRIGRPRRGRAPRRRSRDRARPTWRRAGDPTRTTTPRCGRRPRAPRPCGPPGVLRTSSRATPARRSPSSRARSRATLSPPSLATAQPSRGVSVTTTSSTVIATESRARRPSTATVPSVRRPWTSSPGSAPPRRRPRPPGVCLPNRLPRERKLAFTDTSTSPALSSPRASRDCDVQLVGDVLAQVDRQRAPSRRPR